MYEVEPREDLQRNASLLRRRVRGYVSRVSLLDPLPEESYVVSCSTWCLLCLDLLKPEARGGRHRVWLICGKVCDLKNISVWQCVVKDSRRTRGADWYESLPDAKLGHVLDVAITHVYAFPKLGCKGRRQSAPRNHGEGSTRTYDFLRARKRGHRLPADEDVRRC